MHTPFSNAQRVQSGMEHLFDIMGFWIFQLATSFFHVKAVSRNDSNQAVCCILDTAAKLRSLKCYTVIRLLLRFRVLQGAPLSGRAPQPWLSCCAPLRVCALLSAGCPSAWAGYLCLGALVFIFSSISQCLAVKKL